MLSKNGTLRTCGKGHKYFKTSDCPICPTCEAERKPRNGFLAALSAPARRALENNSIATLEQLSGYSEKEVLKFHGLGKRSIPKLREALQKQQLTFKK